MSDITGHEWRLIREESRSGSMNMALDEIAAETAAAGGPRTVRVYRWDPSCLSLGYGQDPATVDWEYCSRNGIDVTRRQTGGGGIYHDHVGDISYSITAPKDELPGDLLECYHLLCTPILETFRSLGIPAEYADDPRPAIYHPACYLRDLHPAHDILARGRKLSGNAQYRQNDAVIQHGSITFSSFPSDHLAVFSDPDVEAGRFDDRVVGIDELADVTREQVVSELESQLAAFVEATEGSWTDDELGRGRERSVAKYETEEWVHKSSPEP